MKALQLPSLSPQTVAACNRLYAGPSEIRFSCGGMAWTVSFPGCVPAPVWRIAVHVVVGDFPATLFLDGNLFADWAESGLDAAALTTLPPPLLAVLLEVRLEELIAALEPKLGKPVTVERLERLEGGAEAFCPEGSVPFQAVREDGQTLYGVLLAGAELIALIGNIVHRTVEAEKNNRRMADLPIILPVVLGSMALTVGELRSLETGDIVFPTLAAPATAGTLCATLALTAHCRAEGTWYNGTFCVEKMFMAPSDASSDVLSPAPSADTFNPDDIPVTVQFDLGDVRTTVGELAAVKVGHVFTMARHVERPVRMTVNGVVVGEGVLVDVNGLLGVRVVSLGKAQGNGTLPEAPQPTEGDAMPPRSVTSEPADMPESLATGSQTGVVPGTELRT